MIGMTAIIGMTGVTGINGIPDCTGRNNRDQQKVHNVAFDKVGEIVDLDSCPSCKEHTDCFAHINGKCTALNESGGQGCVFYKAEKTAVEENRASYRKLKNEGRSDLILYYFDTLKAIGAMDREVEPGEQNTDSINSISDINDTNPINHKGLYV